MTLQKKETTLLKQHEATWLGALAPFLLNQPKQKRDEYRSHVIKYAFRRGWLAELDIPSLRVELVRALNGAPEAKFLQRVHLRDAADEFEEGSEGIPSYADGTYKPGPDIPKNVGESVSFHLFARCPHLASVRVFHLGNDLTNDYDDSESCGTDGELAHHYVKQMPHIEELRLLAHNVDSNKLFVLPMPQLRVLQLFHAHKYPMDKLAANASLGNLTHLLLQPHAPDDEKPYLRLREVRTICRATNMPKLTHLAMRYTDFGDDGIREIIDSGILKRLKVLDLQGGCVTDEGAKLLAACADARNLERLNLDTNALAAAGIKALGGAKIKASTGRQHTSVPPFDDEMPEYMFEADIE